MTTQFEHPTRGPVELASNQLRSHDFSFRRLTDLSQPCPVCKQPRHYRCRDPQHPWNFAETHPERLPGHEQEDTDEPDAEQPRADGRGPKHPYRRPRWG